MRRKNKLSKVWSVVVCRFAFGNWRADQEPEEISEQGGTFSQVWVVLIEGKKYV
jgi:hypothetical protein